MDANTVTQVLTVVLAVLAIIWHQQRAILKQLGENGERLARIEGLLGIAV